MKGIFALKISIDIAMTLLIPVMLHAVSNLLLFLAMIAMAATSVLVSRDVFSFLSLDSGGDIRTLHVCACTWGFVLMGIHLGFHLNMVAIPLG